MKTTIDGIDYPIPAPHCDPQVLHAPGVCRYCDAYPKWQTKRTVAKMLFWTCPGGRFTSPGSYRVRDGSRALPRRHAAWTQSTPGRETGLRTAKATR